MKKSKAPIATKRNISDAQVLSERNQLNRDLEIARQKIDVLERDSESTYRSLREITKSHKEMVDLCDKQVAELASVRAQLANAYAAVLSTRLLMEVTVSSNFGVGVEKP